MGTLVEDLEELGAWVGGDLCWGWSMVPSPIEASVFDFYGGQCFMYQRHILEGVAIKVTAVYIDLVVYSVTSPRHQKSC